MLVDGKLAHAEQEKYSIEKCLDAENETVDATSSEAKTVAIGRLEELPEKDETLTL